MLPVIAVEMLPILGLLGFHIGRNTNIFRFRKREQNIRKNELNICCKKRKFCNHKK